MREGPRGIRFDFNLGCRVTVPEGKWHVRLSDLDNGDVLFEKDASSFVNSTKRHFLRFRIGVSENGESVFAHDYDGARQPVLIQFPVGTVGDTVGRFPYAEKFRQQHGCKLTCAMSELMIPLFRGAYPEIRLVTHEAVRTEEFYATYCLGLFFDDDDYVWQPCDFRLVGLHRTAGYMLGVDPVPPKIALPKDGPPIRKPYVCIAVQSSTLCKYWNNPSGWHELVRFLKDSVYSVICIDKHPIYGQGPVWIQMPFGAEDETGDRPLLKRASWLKDAEFFVGLSSGLAWLAWAVGTPVGETPLQPRKKRMTCGCPFDHHDFFWCPRHKATPRQFECTRLITAKQVIDTVRRLPGYPARSPSVPVFAGG